MSKKFVSNQNAKDQMTISNARKRYKRAYEEFCAKRNRTKVQSISSYKAAIKTASSTVEFHLKSNTEREKS